MIAAWSLQVLAVGLVVAVLVRALGARAPRVRYALLAVLACKLVVPPGVTAPTGLWGRDGGRLAATIERVVPTTFAPGWSGAPLRVPDAAALSHPETHAASEAFRPGARPTAAWLSAVLVAIFLTGAVVRLAALLREARRLGRLARAARPLADAAPAGVFVGESDEVDAPIAFGLRRPTILLPVALDGRVEGRARRAVLAHELAHLRHRDPLANLALGLLGALWWFHPAAWWLAREARRVQEDLVDDAVVRAGIAPESYCAALLDAARASTSRPLTSSLASGSRDGEHALARRFRRVLSPESPRGRTNAMILSLLPVTLAATLIPGAALPATQDSVSDGFSDARPPLERALGWLADKQGEDGRFLEAEDTPAGDAADALALLAFLGAGHTPTVGPHAPVVARGLARMEARFDETWAGELTLADATGALFLAETSVLTGKVSPALEGALARLTQGLAATAEKQVDPAVAFWSALALFSARDAGIEPDGGTLASALGYVPLDGEVASATGWTRAHTTAAALLLHFLGGGGKDEARIATAIDRVAASGLDATDATLLQLGSYALFQVGGGAWEGWRKRTLPKLDAGQGEDGAWPGEATAPGGRVGATAVRALGLEVMWRYARVVGGR